MRQNRWLFVTVLLLAATLLAACGPTATPAPMPAEPKPTSEEVIQRQAVVEEIDIQILESFPVQVHVLARGYLPDGCTEIDEIEQARSGQAFQVTITTVRPADALCTEAIVPFEEVIALDVLGLKAGTYTVDVNGATGSFELAVDNEPAGGLPPSEQLDEGVLATFDVAGEVFQVWVTNPQTVQQILDLAAGESTANIPNGVILRGSGAADYNLPWSWHLDPQQIEMAEVTTEVCDGRPSYVEEHLDEFVDTVGRYCPWSARLVSVEVLGSPAPPVLIWHREGGLAGFCDDLIIDAVGLVDAASCADDPAATVSHGQLPPDDLARLEAWLDEYQPFEVEQADPATADGMAITLTFAGRGPADPTDADKQQILDFAAEIYAGFTGAR
jgi:hypothetical protein